MAGLFRKDKTKPIDEEVFIKVRSAVTKQAGISEDKITLETRLTNDLNIDLLESIELVMELEEAFNIEIQDADAEKMQTVKDIASYITARFRERKQ
ncbi:MAG: acyl carrier protein [Candidatus Omnitrophota bacterium]